jgi:quinol monooxygenase YgiN
MIVITGYLSVKPDSIDAVKAGATALMLATRKEAGCITYKFTQEVEDPTVFWFIEEWETDEALTHGRVRQGHRQRSRRSARRPQVRR